jgi:uncharacterized repeat protein (TIGR03803 family)
MNRIVPALALLFFSAGTIEAQTVSNVYSFPGTTASAGPGFVTPAQGRDGTLYGTTQGSQYGSVFKVSTSGVETDLYAFDFTNGDDPASSIILSSDGNYYGTAAAGGSTNQGVLFKVTPGGTYTALHEFSGGADGGDPLATPLLASDGNIYGATLGAQGTSTIYKYNAATGFTTIYQFDGTHGSSPGSPLIQGMDGNLYGSASSGGANNCGTLFKMSRSGVILNYFSLTCGVGGNYPFGSLVLATDGSIYGATNFGGAFNLGILFQWTKKGTYNVLYQFTGKTDGEYPYGLMQATDGNLYGTARGGANNNGVLFKLTTSGTYTLLYNFQTSVGQSPGAPPLQDTNGAFYGTTASGGTYGFGGVYKLNTGLAPFITFVQSTGKAGRSTQILGQKLTGATSITFNGVPATSFTVLRDTYMTAVVPTGATTGPVVVTTPAGTFASNVNFRIQP